MMEPLRNLGELGSRDEAEAARLLRTVGPADPLPVVEQRVYASLGRPRRFGPRALRIASVTSVSIVTTTILAMTMGTILHRGGKTLAPTPPVSPLPPAPPSAVESFVPPAAPRPGPSMKPEAPAPVVAQARAASRPGPLRTSLDDPRRARTPADPPVSAAPVTTSAPAVDLGETTEARVAAAPPEEAALVLAGLRALRRQHDPSQAGVLLTRYLNHFPQGTLVQEALAIAIEAGLARGERQTAAQLAAQYLDRFPAGRFVRLARKAADSTGP
jgi:hypothetical protein